LKKQYLKYFSKSNREDLRDREAIEIPFDQAQVHELCRSGVHDLVTDIGLLGAISFLEDEVSQLCGKWHDRQTNRAMTRYGAQPGWVAVSGQKVTIKRPRVRYANGGGEVRLSRYQRFQHEENLGRVVMRRIVRGVSCRNYEGVVDDLRRSRGIKKSTVSRRFIAGMAGRIKKLTERRWDDTRLVAIFIDGKAYDGEMMIVALGVKADGSKVLLGLRQGATENAEVCKDLLEDLQSRGVARDQMTLFVLDGSQALRAAVKRVWGRFALVARCQVHKRHNIRKYLAQEYWGELDRRLNEAWYGDDYDPALVKLKRTADWLEGINPDAARSLREGMEETLTVVRLGIPDLLRQTLSSTNVIESAFSVSGSVSDRVKRWKSGEMRWRWCAAGLMFAEEKFRRVKGYRLIPRLITALDEIARKDGLDSKSQVA
jgi:putative transposase